MQHTLFGLSIGQPWLDMILRGVKSIEIRSWNVKRRGNIALHASWQIDFSISYFYGYETPWLLPRGRVVAIADIVDVVFLDYVTWQKRLVEHRQPLPFAVGCYGICLANIRVLDHSIKCRGRPGFFPLPEGVSDKLRAL